MSYNNLMVFDSEEFGRVRTVVIENKEYFVAKDVALALGYKEPHKAISRHCKGVMKRPIGVVTGKRSDGTDATQTIEMSIIPEGDIYRLIIRSKLPSAERFETWVFDEVLPQIRKTGGFIQLDEGDTDLEILSKAMLIAQKTLSQKDELIKKIQPKADKYDNLLDSERLTSWEQFVKIANLELGRGKFMDILRLNGILLKGGRTPYQVYMDRDYFEVKLVPIPTGKYVEQTFVTTKGLDWLLGKCKEWDLYK